MPEDLIGIRAYVRWEEAGMPEDTPPEWQAAEYAKARLDLQLEVLNGVTLNDIRRRYNQETVDGDDEPIFSRGDADVMLAGGAEACVDAATIAGFARARALADPEAMFPGSTTRTEKGPPKTGSANDGEGSYRDADALASRSCRPFDADRGGFVIGEGAGVLVLETLEGAVERGAAVYGEIRGFGQAGDARGMFSLGLARDPLHRDVQWPEIDKDANAAAGWYAKAREAGHVKASTNLGILYWEGLSDGAAGMYEEARRRFIRESRTTESGMGGGLRFDVVERRPPPPRRKERTRERRRLSS